MLFLFFLDYKECDFYSWLELDKVVHFMVLVTDIYITSMSWKCGTLGTQQGTMQRGTFHS